MSERKVKINKSFEFSDGSSVTQVEIKNGENERHNKAYIHLSDGSTLLEAVEWPRDSGQILVKLKYYPLKFLHFEFMGDTIKNTRFFSTCEKCGTTHLCWNCGLCFDCNSEEEHARKCWSTFHAQEIEKKKREFEQEEERKRKQFVETPQNEPSHSANNGTGCLIIIVLICALAFMAMSI
jgi:hypothetical protein